MSRTLIHWLLAISTPALIFGLPDLDAREREPRAPIFYTCWMYTLPLLFFLVIKVLSIKLKNRVVDINMTGKE
jgi:hypothetical protein